MSGDTWVGIATVIAALGAAVASVLAALRTGTVSAKVDAVHDEVKTGNGMTLGEYADATEARRTGSTLPSGLNPPQ